MMAIPSQAQQSLSDSLPQFYEPQSKLINLSLTTIRDFGVATQSDQFGNDHADIRENLRRDFSARFPFYIKDGWALGLGFLYRHEQFRFEDITNTNYPLFQQLENKGLRRTGFDVLFQRTTKNKHTIQGSFGIQFNGDTYKSRALLRLLKVSGVVIYSTQKSPRTEIGWGVLGGYDLGSPRIYPVFSYKHFFNKHLKLQMTLPRSVNLSYGFSNKMFLTFTTELSGASYHIVDELLEGFDNLQIRKSEVRAKLRFDREIHDWLWFGIEYGGLRYINFFVSDPQGFQDNEIVDLQPELTQFMKFSLYMTPPKKFLEAIKNR
ncbi:MAG: DUF6268 family outer membrane beta-barrel protein [Flammeovirgaceae bacterium]